jgi:hypothetical protein
MQRHAEPVVMGNPAAKTKSSQVECWTVPRPFFNEPVSYNGSSATMNGNMKVTVCTDDGSGNKNLVLGFFTNLFLISLAQAKGMHPTIAIL